MICFGSDVNSLSSARLGGERGGEPAPLVGLVWLGIHLRAVASLSATKEKDSSMGVYLNFDVFDFYTHTHIFHAHSQTTPADTAHTDEWLRASQTGSIL